MRRRRLSTRQHRLTVHASWCDTRRAPCLPLREPFVHRGMCSVSAHKDALLKVGTSGGRAGGRAAWCTRPPRFRLLGACGVRCESGRVAPATCGALTTAPAGAQARRLPAVSWLQAFCGGAAPTSLAVRQKVDRRWQVVQWRFSTPEEFGRYLRHGQLHEVDAGGSVVRSVVRPEDLRDGAAYVFRATDTTDVAGAVKSLASGHERESTAALARDACLAAALGPLHAFNSGEPFTFTADGVVWLEVDGLVLCTRRPLILLNEAKLTPLAGHVTEVRARCAVLETLLRGPVSGGTNWPDELNDYRTARVLPCLSGVNFAPDVQAAALAAGVVPVLCSGARFHVAPQAVPLLPPEDPTEAWRPEPRTQTRN